MEGSPHLGRTGRRAQATPNPKRILQIQLRRLAQRPAALGARARAVALALAEGVASYLADLVGARGVRLVLNTSVAVLVLSLPFAASTTSRASTSVGATVAASAAIAVDGARAQPVARGQIAASRNPLTVAAEGVLPIQHRTIAPGDTLDTMANF